MTYQNLYKTRRYKYWGSDKFAQRKNIQQTSFEYGMCYHYSLWSGKSISSISCNYVENVDSGRDGKLIATYSKLSMFDCCILRNEIPYTFYLRDQGSIVFNNSFADKYSAISQTNSVEYINTFANSECKYYIDILENEIEGNSQDEEDELDDIEKVKQIVRYLNKTSNFIHLIS